MPPAPLASSLATAFEVVPELLLACLYAGRVRVLARAAQPTSAWRQVSFYASLLLAALTIALLGVPSHQMAVWHALNDILIGDVAPLLFVLGLTHPLLAPLERVPGADLLRLLWNPFVAFTIWTLNLYGWHVPRLYQAGLHHGYVHSVEYLSSFVAGVLMWLCLCGPVRHPRWFGDGAKLVYAVAVRLAGIALGTLLLWAGGVVYGYYLQEDAMRQFSPVADENLAGGLILLDQSIMLVGVFGWLYLRARSSGVEEPRSASRITVSG